MRHIPSIHAILLLVAVTTGCQLPGRDGPVPQSLSDCRRLSQQGMAALDRGDQAKAELLLSKAVAACSVDAEARRRYAESLWRRDARQEAIIQMEEAGRLTPDDGVLWTRLAEMRLAVGQGEFARRDAELALSIDPKLAAAWAIRGAVLHTTGQPAEALADYLRALNFAPTDRNILLAAAELHRELNHPDRALQTLQTLADTYSPGEESGQLLYLTGLAYSAIRRYDDAADSLAAAVARPNPTAEMFYCLGEAQLLAGHANEAAAAANQALAMQPQHQPSRNLLERIEIARRPQENIR